VSIFFFGALLMSDAKSHHANSRLRLRLNCFKRSSSTGEEHPDEQRLRAVFLDSPN